MKNCSVAKLTSLNMVIASKTHLLLISVKKGKPETDSRLHTFQVSNPSSVVKFFHLSNLCAQDRHFSSIIKTSHTQHGW